MTPEQFVYWLQGYLEVADPAQLDAKKTKIIKDHLKTVFKKVTPEYKITQQLVSPSPLFTRLGNDCGFRGNLEDTAKHRVSCSICSPINLVAVC